MTRLPDLLRLLTRDEFLAAADRLGVALPERRAKDPIVEALAAAPAATAEAVLADLKRDRLEALCRALDLDDSGKEKAEIIARLAGGPATSEPRGQAKLDLPGTTDPPAPRRGRPPKAREDAVEALTPAPVSGPLTSDAPRRGRPPSSASPARNNDDKAGSLGFEDKLWAAADVLRNNMDPAEYKHVVLGLFFLKYVSDAFEERRAQLLAAGDADLVEDRDEYTAEKGMDLAS